MRGRLSMTSLYDVNGLVPDIRRQRVIPSVTHPAASIIEGRVPRPNPVSPYKGMVVGPEGRTPRVNAADLKIMRVTERWIPRRWPQMLSDDLSPITPRATPDLSFTPGVVQSSAAPSGGFWATIASGLSSAVAGVLPAFAQVQTARLMTTQNAALLRQAGTQLYTPGNIQTLQQQAEFEAAQRLINQGRTTGATSLPISGTMLAVLGVGALGLYLARKK